MKTGSLCEIAIINWMTNSTSAVVVFRTYDNESVES